MGRFWRAPAYLRSHSAAETRDPRRNGLAWAMGLEEGPEAPEGLTFFEALERDPEHAEFWKVAMEGAQYGRGGFPWAELWREVVSRSEEEEEEEEENGGRGRAFVVDVGGGRGRALVEIMRDCGSGSEGGFKGRMVLEDLGFVLEGEQPVLIEGVENIVCDFFQEDAEQPVKSKLLCVFGSRESG